MVVDMNTSQVPLLALALALALSTGGSARAEMDWFSVTLDNDLFVGEDSGYTNGIYFSAFDVGDSASLPVPEHDFWVQPLLWSMPTKGVEGAINAYTFGQTMNTPTDIEVANPGADELPYSALLALTNSYVVVNADYADRVSTTLGVVGPWALGEEAQKLVHKLTDSDEPQGWDTQIKNEVVFQLSRGRAWRTWEAASGRVDLLTSAEIMLGTIASAIDGGVVLRYGSNLASSYATTLFSSARTANPAATQHGWFVYGGFKAGYVFNQIFTDGNTFRDSRAVDYDHEFIAVTAGLAYSWEDFALTFAINDANLLQDGSTEDAIDSLTRFGTITAAWRL